jgi:MbtH protein
MTQVRNEEDRRMYSVLVNAEEQYCIWIQEKEVPDGWRRAGMEGTRGECIAFVDATWTDMTPLSLRKVR